MDRGLLDFALEKGIINTEYIQAQIDQMKRKKYLDEHNHKIWQGKDGKWRTYVDTEHGRKLIKLRRYEDVEDRIVEYARYYEEDDRPSFNDVFKMWNDRRLELKKISPATHGRNEQAYNRFFKDFGILKVADVDPVTLGDWLEELVPLYDLKPKAWSGIKSIVRNMLRFAKRYRLIDYSIDEVLNSLDVSETEFHQRIKEDYEEVFDDEEREAVIQALIDYPDQRNLGLLLLFYTGMRVGELSALKQCDLDESGSIKIRRTETRYKLDGEWHIEVKENPKTNAGWRTIVVPSEAQWILKRLKKDDSDDYVFEYYTGKRMHACSFRKRLKNICDNLGIYPKSPHKIRKTYGSILLDNHFDTRMILDQMGHASISTTTQHYHRNLKNFTKKQEMLDALPEFSK